MKVMWITNTLLPKACEYLNRPYSVSGGWLWGFLDAFSNSDHLQFCIVINYYGKKFHSFHAEGVEYHLVPMKKAPTKYDRSLEKYFGSICGSFQPEVIHIHGTEYYSAMACLNACPDFKYVVSIQGLVSVIARYTYAGIGVKEIWRNLTIRDLIKRDSIFHSKKQYRRRGIYEAEYISRVDHVIGRTFWDEVHSKTMHRGINYHFCNDNLRQEFYNTSQRWNVQSIETHSIYVSQGYTPIKGLHMLLKAAHLIRDKYPSLKIYVAGHSPIKSNSLRGRLTIMGYGKYLKGLLRKFSLEQNVIFTGPITVDGVINRLLQSHVCVFPSSIENGSSLGEAQYLGTPGIVSYAGGMPTTVEHEKTGLMYRFEEYEMLADAIQRIFDNNQLAEKLSDAGKIVASQRHDGGVNAKNLMSIYSQVGQVTI